MARNDPRNRNSNAQAVATKTNPHVVKVWRKGNTGDLGKRGIEFPLWQKVQDYVEEKAEEAGSEGSSKFKVL